MNEIKKLLNDFGKSIVEEYPLINHGGCCVFAAEMGKYFEKYFQTCIKVSDAHFWENAVLNDINDKIIFYKGRVFTWNKHGVYFGHVVVELKIGRNIYHYDTSGLFPRKQHDQTYFCSFYKGELSVSTGLKLAKNSDGWNHKFDREYIPEIKAKIKSFFKEHDKVFKKLKG